MHDSKCPDPGPRGGPPTEATGTSGGGWAVPLQLCAFQEGFALCNPSAEPAGMTGFWQVSPAEVASIDRALLAFLRQKMSEAVVLDLERYGRQYLGFLRGGGRHVFIHAFPQFGGVTPSSAETHVLRVCDNSWEAEYDLGTQQFTKFGLDQGPPLHP